MIDHATIIPLIGGEAIASEQAFGCRPKYIVSYSPFVANDSHLLNHWENEVPYHLIDQGGFPADAKVDVVSSVCPCAGLSMLSLTASGDSKVNDWLYSAAEWVLEHAQPRVYWGENAPNLMSGMGDKVRERLESIAAKHGYTVSYYKTKTLLHGLPQVRNRSFYFMWKGDMAPVLPYYNKPYPRIEELILGVKSNFQQEPINKKKPSDEPFYRYLLEEVHQGVDHRKYMTDILEHMPIRGNDSKSLIEMAGHSYERVADWMDARGEHKVAKKCREIHEKLKAGGSIMKRDTILAKDYIGAFVGHYPHMLAHPREDRYITYREAMSIMGLPDNFELLNPERSVNHICQNVPVHTARDMADAIKQALERPDSLEWVSGTVYQYNPSREHRVENYQPKQTLEAFL